jgi:hypothetical protein
MKVKSKPDKWRVNRGWRQFRQEVEMDEGRHIVTGRYPEACLECGRPYSERALVVDFETFGGECLAICSACDVWEEYFQFMYWYRPFAVLLRRGGPKDISLGTHRSGVMLDCSAIKAVREAGMFPEKRAPIKTSSSLREGR